MPDWTKAVEETCEITEGEWNVWFRDGASTVEVKATRRDGKRVFIPHDVATFGADRREGVEDDEPFEPSRDDIANARLGADAPAMLKLVAEMATAIFVEVANSGLVDEARGGWYRRASELLRRHCTLPAAPVTDVAEAVGDVAQDQPHEPAAPAAPEVPFSSHT